MKGNDFMTDIEKYFENTKNASPHNNIRRFIEIEKNLGNAIDLGCGTGRDTVFLIKNNWNVLAIDREDTREIIEQKLDAKELNRFEFSCQNFENIDLKESDLIVANYSVPFCSKNYFNEFWNKIVSSISEGRVFCW